MEDHQDEHQSTMIEIEGNILIQTMSILVDLRASLSYANLKIMNKCKLNKEKYKNSWLV